MAEGGSGSAPNVWARWLSFLAMAFLMATVLGALSFWAAVVVLFITFVVGITMMPVEKSGKTAVDLFPKPSPPPAVRRDRPSGPAILWWLILEAIGGLRRNALRVAVSVLLFGLFMLVGLVLMETLRHPNPIGALPHAVAAIGVDAIGADESTAAADNPRPGADRLTILVDFVGDDLGAAITYRPYRETSAGVIPLRPIEVTVTPTYRGLGVEEIVAMAATETTAPATRVEVTGLPAGAFLSARAASELTVTAYAGEDVAEWSMADLRHGVGFAFVRPPAQHFKGLLGSVLGAASGSDALLMLIAAIATPLGLAAAGAIPKGLLSVLDTALGWSTKE